MTKRYSLFLNGPKVLQIKYGFFYRKIEIWLNGKIVGKFNSTCEARRGKSFVLLDGKKLYFKQMASPLFVITLDGNPLPETWEHEVYLKFSNRFRSFAYSLFIMQLLLCIWFTYDLYPEILNGPFMRKYFALLGHFYQLLL